MFPVHFSLKEYEVAHWEWKKIDPEVCPICREEESKGKQENL